MATMYGLSYKTNIDALRKRQCATHYNYYYKKGPFHYVNFSVTKIRMIPYTGLRIGASTSKGLCFGGNIPLISLNTLLVIAAMAKAKSPQNYDLIVPMIDARRMEVYTMLTNAKLDKLSEEEAKIIDAESFAEHKGKRLLFCGNGAPKCKEVLACDGFTFMDNIYPSAEFMGELAEAAFINKQFEDLVYYEPFYLKEFIATTSKKSLF